MHKHRPIRSQLVTRTALFLALVMAFAGCSSGGSTKKVALAYYNLAYIDKKPTEAAKKYMAPNLIQHNAFLPDGTDALASGMEAFFRGNPEASASIKRVVAEGNLAVLHVHFKSNNQDPGRAVVEIFRVEGGKIVEHWDVLQPVTGSQVNKNTVF